MSYTEHPKFNPEWEHMEFVYLDRKWETVEWIYINPDANDAPQFVSMNCTFGEFYGFVHDALESAADFWDFFNEGCRQYLFDRHSNSFEGMCEFLTENKPDFAFEKDESGGAWAVMRVYGEITRIYLEEDK